jgi:hypothetical protein
VGASAVYEAVDGERGEELHAEVEFGEGGGVLAYCAVTVNVLNRRVALVTTSAQYGGIPSLLRRRPSESRDVN